MRSASSGLLLAAMLVPGAATAACDAPGFHAFDFWLGDWQVARNDAEARVAGSNRIERIAGGCALLESWTGSGGTIGTSLNTFDPASGVWRQRWVDSTGTLLELEGGLVDGAMVLTGTLPDKDGKPVRQRITWQAREDGSVRQHWQASADGEHWQTAFDGIYRKR